MEWSLWESLDGSAGSGELTLGTLCCDEWEEPAVLYPPSTRGFMRGPVNGVPVGKLSMVARTSGNAHRDSPTKIVG